MSINVKLVVHCNEIGCRNKLFFLADFPQDDVHNSVFYKSSGWKRSDKNSDQDFCFECK